MGTEGEDETGWLSSWEQQCAESVEAEPDFNQSLVSEIEGSQRRVWGHFQDSATAVAQLYRDRYSGEPATLYLQFQTAAGTVTSLYRESTESIKKVHDLARQSGYQKRNNELLHWAKRKRRLIRREDLLAYLAGKPPPPRQGHHHHRSSPRPRNISPPPLHTISRDDHLLSPTGGTPHFADPNLHMFREALALTTRRSPSTNGNVDLCAFIAGEMARHCAKRPASPHDVPMGSPTQQKKPRYM